jgi:hypothetical protein
MSAFFWARPYGDSVSGLFHKPDCLLRGLIFDPAALRFGESVASGSSVLIRFSGREQIGINIVVNPGHLPGLKACQFRLEVV